MKTFALACLALTLCACAPNSSWMLVDDFETSELSSAWTNIDAQNDTEPFIPTPQVARVVAEPGTGNHYMLRKPAEDGVVGNRKAINFHPLPNPIQIGEIATLYTRIQVERFPNNHSFGLSNVSATEIGESGYDAFEPMIRVTDKAESDGTKNDGTLMVLSGYKTYDKIGGPTGDGPAQPMQPGAWYELWYVINNTPKDAGGQRYDLYVRGGEFTEQTRVFDGAVFRMNRDAPLKHFMTICNTGPADKPYGNGGVSYDDIYMSAGKVLSSPLGN